MEVPTLTAGGWFTRFELLVADMSVLSGKGRRPGLILSFRRLRRVLSAIEGVLWNRDRSEAARQKIEWHPQIGAVLSGVERWVPEFERDRFFIDGAGPHQACLWCWGRPMVSLEPLVDADETHEGKGRRRVEIL